MDMSSSTSSTDKVCIICLESISLNPKHKEEKGRVLDCSHLFHRECIGEWLKRKHNCPMCRAHVETATPEAPREEMTLEEILAVPDVYRRDLLEVHARRIDLNENTPEARNAREIVSVFQTFLEVGESRIVRNNVPDVYRRDFLEVSEEIRVRRARRFDLNENTPKARTARNIDSFIRNYRT